MIKKLASAILCFALLFGLSLPAMSATDDANADQPPAMGEMSGQNGPGGAGEPPQGEAPSGGDMPAAPEGEPLTAQEGARTQTETAQSAPSSDNGNTQTENTQQTQPSSSGSTQAENTQQTQPSSGSTQTETTQQIQPSGDEAATDRGNSGFNGGNMSRGDRNDMGEGRQEAEENADATSQVQTSRGISGFFQTYGTLIVSVLMLIGAFVFVKFYKRKLY